MRTEIIHYAATERDLSLNALLRNRARLLPVFWQQRRRVQLPMKLIEQRCPARFENDHFPAVSTTACIRVRLCTETLDKMSKKTCVFVDHVVASF